MRWMFRIEDCTLPLIIMQVERILIKIALTNENLGTRIPTTPQLPGIKRVYREMKN